MKLLPLSALLALAACAPAVVDDTPAAPGGPALLFAPLPDAFRLPDDDVDPAADGLQVDVTLQLDNADDAAEDVVTVVSAGGFSVDVGFDDEGTAVARVALDVAALPGGAANRVVASAGDLDAERNIIGLDLRDPPPPISCSISVDTVGVAIVTCDAEDDAEDADDADVLALANGGLVALDTTDDAGVTSTQQAELRGGQHAFPFAFPGDVGVFVFVARLVDAAAVTGSAVTATTSANVDVP